MRGLMFGEVLFLFIAADPVPPATTLDLGQPVTVPVGKKCVLEATTSAKKVTWKVPAGCDAMPLDGKRLAVWANPGTYVFTAMVPSGEDVVSKELVLTVVGAQPPPIPPEPGPTPIPPGPVTSFRVIYVYETAAPLTPAMQKAMFADSVRTYLDAKTTGVAGVGKGYRRYDKDVDASQERDANMKALWTAVKPKLTTIPCVVVEVNGKADILPFPADDVAALALFKKYAGG